MDALTLVTQGEHSLLSRDPAGVELFQKASQLEPQNADLLFRQALALYEYGQEEGKKNILLLASKKLRTATLLNPLSFRYWQLWGSVLCLLGKISGSHHYFLEAKKKCTRALPLIDNQDSSILSDFYWDYGVVWKHIAEKSEEALDFQVALDAFGKASDYSDQFPEEFWNDFGQTALCLAGRINDIRLYVKAINCFKHAIATSISSSEGWILLAGALQALYAYTHDEDHFSQANECFAAAAKTRPQNADLWLNWAKLLCNAGRQNQDTKRLRSCIEKCHRAHACDPNNSLITATWAEALALLGELSERLDILYDAQNKIAESVQTSEEHPDLWYAYGMCFNSFARYFNDTDYYYQAIEKFQQGTSLDRTCHRHWHAIATAYATIGQLEGDLDALELSCRFFSKAIDLQASSFYIYDYARALSKIGEITHEQQWLEEALVHFERALNIQKNAVYLHPEWLFHYASTLDMLGDFYEEESYYLRAIEILSHVLTIDPDFPHIHHRLALCFAHIADLNEDVEHFHRAAHHYRLAAKHEEENDQILLDWGVTLINLSQHLHVTCEIEQFFREAESKLTQAAKLGNLLAFYHLSCLYSLQGHYEKAIRFLEKADSFSSLPPLEELLQDDWLDDLRDTPDFHEFLSHLETRPKNLSQ